jgi:hypothetical protein
MKACNEGGKFNGDQKKKHTKTKTLKKAENLMETGDMENRDKQRKILKG